MISVRRAFNRHTTTEVLHSIRVAGTWDINNQWVEGTLNAPTKILATPIPQGDKDAGVFGEQMQAHKIGEREPSFMKFHSRVKIEVNELLTVYNTTYKVIRVGNYDAAGFRSVVGAKIFDVTVTETTATTQVVTFKSKDDEATVSTEVLPASMDVAGWT